MVAPEPDLSFFIYHISFSEAPWFCQDFSWNFSPPEKFDRKFRGEILKIKEGNLEDFSLKFAVKFRPIHKPLKFSNLQNLRKIADFVKIFHKKPASKTRVFWGVVTRPQGVAK
jgi:hypothetical protein